MTAGSADEREVDIGHRARQPPRQLSGAAQRVAGRIGTRNRGAEEAERRVTLELVDEAAVGLHHLDDDPEAAARLSELAKRRPERVLASQAALTRTATAETVAWSATKPARLRGRTAPTGVAHPRS